MAKNETAGKKKPAEKTGPWSVVYAIDGQNGVERLGPFPSEERATEAARAAQADGTFDVSDCEVYLLDPNHRMVAFSVDELTEGE